MEHADTKGVAPEQAATGNGLSVDELEAQAAEELPDREAMTLIDPSLGGPVGARPIYDTMPVESPGDTLPVEPTPVA